MLCPQCGKECGEGYKFCLSCGCRLDESIVNRNTDNNLYSQNFQGVSYNDFIPQIPSDSSVAVKSKGASGAKKGIIIGVIALLVALLGVAAFFFIRNRMERDYLVNNPTQYVFSSYQTFFNNSNSDENDLFAILKDLENQGSVKFTAEQKGNGGNDGQQISSDVQFSYNIPENKYYFMMSGKNAPSQFSNPVGDTLFEIYTDINRIDMNFDVNGKQGKYYIDSGKIREQAGNSIFSPNRDNVLNIDQEQFNDFLTQFENIYHKLSSNNDSNNEINEFYDNLLKKIEQDCKVTVEEGATTVNGNSVSVDIVTYTFGYDSILAVLKDVKEEIVTYLTNNEDKIENSDEYIKNVEEYFDNLISEFTGSSEAKSVMIVVKNYMRKDNKEIAKLEFGLNNTSSSSQSSNMQLTLEFSRDPYMNINFTVSNGMFSVGASLHKEVSGDVTSYILSTSSNMGGSLQNQEIARLDYDDANNKLTLTAGGQSYSCDAEVKDNTMTLIFDVPVDSSYGVKSNNTISMKIEISSEPKMNTINAEKNLFDITKEEFESLTASTYQPSYDYYNYDDYYDNNDGYREDTLPLLDEAV